MGEIHSGKSKKNIETKNFLPQRHSNSTWIKKCGFFCGHFYLFIFFPFSSFFFKFWKWGGGSRTVDYKI